MSPSGSNHIYTRVSLPPDKIEMCLSPALCFTSEYLGQLNFAINLQEQNPDLQTRISRSSREAQPMAKNMPSVTSQLLVGEGMDTIFDLSKK